MLVTNLRKLGQKLDCQIENLDCQVENLGCQVENQGCQVKNQECQVNQGNKVSFDTQDFV